MCAVKVRGFVEREQAGACKAGHVSDNERLSTWRDVMQQVPNSVLNVFFLPGAGMQSC